MRGAEAALGQGPRKTGTTPAIGNEKQSKILIVVLHINKL
jgi:hypothetical protein